MSKKEITASLVKELRQICGVSVMECKKALEKSQGNLEEAMKWLKQKGREKAMKKAQRETKEGVVASYIHSNKKVGAMIELYCETDFAAKGRDFQDLAYDLAMHVAAMDPQYLSAEKVGRKEKEEYENLVKEESSLTKKPAEIADKIIEGKLKKHFGERSLLSQPFIKNTDMNVDELIKERIAKIGENIQIGDFVRFEI